MSLQMAQPPLHSSANVKHDAEVATEHWKILTPRFKAKARLATIAPALTSGSSTTKTFADNESFPNTKPYSVGFELQDFVAIFDVGTEVQMH